MKHQLAGFANRLLAPVHIKIVPAGFQEALPIEISLDGHTFRCDGIHQPFWRAFESGRWEPETRAILRDHLTADDVFYDCGAWLGPFTLYASTRCRQVYSFEPDPIACRFLLENITRNELSNVRAFNLAVSDGDGVGSMSSFAAGLGDSQSSLLRRHDGYACPVTTVSFETIVSRLSCEPPTFIKMDIEASEFVAIPGNRTWLERYRPTLLLSVHAPQLPSDTRELAVARLRDALDGLYPPFTVPLDDYASYLLEPPRRVA